MITQIDIPTTRDWPERVARRAHDYVTRYESCSQSIVASFLDELGIDDPLVLRAAGAMHGGMVSSLTCGVVSGGMMVLGLLMGRERLSDGMDGLFPVVLPGQELVARLERRLGSTSCRELSGVDFTDLEQAIHFISSGDNAKCIDYVATGAEEIALFLQELAARGELYRVEVTGHREAPGPVPMR